MCIYIHIYIYIYVYMYIYIYIYKDEQKERRTEMYLYKLFYLNSQLVSTNMVIIRRMRNIINATDYTCSFTNMTLNCVSHTTLYYMTGYRGTL